MWREAVLKLVALTLLSLSLLLWIYFHWAGLNRLFPLAIGMEFWPYLLLIPGLGLGLRLTLPKLRRQILGLGLAMLLLVLNAAPVMHWLGVPALENSPEGLKVMAYNVWLYNDDYEAIQRSIEQENPDILFLTELSGAAMQTLRDRLDYPYSARSTVGTNAFFSRYPLLSVSSKYPHVDAHGQTFSFIARIQAETEVLTVVGFHPPIPLTRSSFAVRNQQFRRLAPYLRQLQGRVIVLGDFNASPWSPYLQQFEQEADLVSATQGHWIWATWSYHSQLPLRLAKLPIDHVEVRGFQSVGAWTGHAGGSDHRPVIAVLKGD